MARRKRRISQEQATSRCAWCSKQIDPDEEVFGLGAKARPWVELPEGSVLELSMDATHRRVLAIVPADDPPAKQAGNDLLFATCSQECGESLRDAIRKQIDFFEGPGSISP